MINTINFQLLLESGMPQEKIRELVIYLQGQVCLDLYQKIRTTFDQPELVRMDKEFAAEKDQTKQIELLEKYYFQKTGKHFLDSAYEILQRYLDLLVAIFRQATEDLQKIAKLKKADLEAVKSAVDKKDYPQIKVLLDKFLGEPHGQ